MNNGWCIAAALAALGLCACGGGTGPAPFGPVATPIPSPPSLATLGYALQRGGRGSPRVLGEYPMAATTPSRTFEELGGSAIRFDPAGTLWSDRIGDFAGYRPDGSSAGTMNQQGSLRGFDVQGRLYVASCCSLDVYGVGSGNATTLIRSIPTTPSFACSAAADGAGNIYVAFCRAGPNGSEWTALYELGPDATDTLAPLATNGAATGPVTVDHAGNVYAPYNGAIGMWLAGRFGAGVPDRSLPVGAATTVLDIAADRAGNVYAVTRLTAGSFISAPRSLLYFAAGSAAPVTLQSGDVGSVAAVP